MLFCCVQSLGLPCRPLGLLAAAKGDFPAFGVAPVGEVLKAGLSGEFGAVEGAKLPQEPRGRGPNGEALEVGKPRFPLLDAEEVACEAVGQNQGGMSAVATFPHPCEDVARHLKGLSQYTPLMWVATMNSYLMSSFTASLKVV